MTDEFGFETALFEGYEDRLEELLDRLEAQEGGGAYEFSQGPARAAFTSSGLRVPGPADIRVQIQRHRDAYAKLIRAVEAMRKHLIVRNGHLHFTLPARSAPEAAARLGIDPDLFSHLYQSVKMRNLHAGQIGLGSARGARPASEAIVSTEVQLESARSCAGVTKVEKLFWGVRLWLDECKTQDLIGTLKTGGNAGSLCSLLGPEGKVICTVLAVLGSVELGLIDVADKSGGSQGVILSWTWVNIGGAIVMPPAAVALSIPIVISQGWSAAR